MEYSLKLCIMKKSIISIIILYTSIFISVQSQVDIKFFKNNRSDGGISYNFFLGDDASDFSTTITGFGSGFIFDAFTGRYSFDFITVGTDAINMSLGIGLAISKYRFSENIVFEKTADQVTYSTDDNSDHNYGSGFFSYGKSKLVYGSFYIPLNLNITIKELYFSAGVLIDQYISGKLKRKFKENGKNQVIVVGNNDFNDYFLNKTKYGCNALIVHKNSGFGLGFTYMVTPFFEKDKGPTLNEARISLTYEFSNLAKKNIDFNKKEEVEL